MLLVVATIDVSSANWPVDESGAKMMSYTTLLGNGRKFDHKAVWVIGGFAFANGIGRLGRDAKAKSSVCVRPIEAFADPTGTEGTAILRRFDGLSVVSVQGRYELASTTDCPNGTLFAALVEVSLE